MGRALMIGLEWKEMPEISYDGMGLGCVGMLDIIVLT